MGSKIQKSRGPAKKNGMHAERESGRDQLDGYSRGPSSKEHEKKFPRQEKITDTESDTAAQNPCLADITYILEILIHNKSLLSVCI